MQKLSEDGLLLSKMRTVELADKLEFSSLAPVL